MTALEICIEDVAGARGAIAGGADRIELCAALALGGLTPSPALLARVLAVARPAGVAVHAMVRPRAGDFAYDADTLDLALAEGEALVAAGCDGLVFGACSGGTLDGEALGAWIARFAGRPVELTLHRAIDLVHDLPGAVEQAVSLGFHRILSSGGAIAASQGIDTLRAMVDRAAGRCRIAAGAGVRADNAAALVAATGVDEVHASASQAGVFDAAVLALGFAAGARRWTSPATVAALRAAIKPS